SRECLHRGYQQQPRGGDSGRRHKRSLPDHGGQRTESTHWCGGGCSGQCLHRGLRGPPRPRGAAVAAAGLRRRGDPGGQDQQTQTITFSPLASQVVGGSLTLSASASSNLTVSFASRAPAVCTVSGTTATFATVGTCTIQASQSGNTSYAAATPVSQSFSVNL